MSVISNDHTVHAVQPASKPNRKQPLLFFALLMIFTRPSRRHVISAQHTQSLYYYNTISHYPVCCSSVFVLFRVGGHPTTRRRRLLSRSSIVLSLLTRNIMITLGLIDTRFDRLIVVDTSGRTRAAHSWSGTGSQQLLVILST